MNKTKRITPWSMYFSDALKRAIDELAIDAKRSKTKQVEVICERDYEVKAKMAEQAPQKN